MTTNSETYAALRRFWSDPVSFAAVFNAAVFPEAGSEAVRAEDLRPAEALTNISSSCLGPAVRETLNGFLDTWAETSTIFYWNTEQPLYLCMKHQLERSECMSAQIELYNALQVAAQLGDTLLQHLLAEGPLAATHTYEELTECGLIVPTMVLVVYYGDEAARPYAREDVGFAFDLQEAF